MASVIPYAMREILKRIVECSSNEDPDVRSAFWAAEKEYFDRYMNEKCVPREWIYDKHNAVKQHTVHALELMGVECFYEPACDDGHFNVVLDRNGMQMKVENIH